jgi:uncharacterized protein YcbX
MSGLGSVAGLWRYPVKSMQGEPLDAAHATERGFLGDRVYALIDSATEKVVSAKHPKKWPGILEWRARFLGTPAPDSIPAVRVQFPDGSAISSDDAGFNARVSNAFQRDVVLRSIPPEKLVLEEYWPDIEGLAHRETVTDETFSLGTSSGTFFDFSAIHLLTKSTLGTLERAYPAGCFDLRRFRPNILLEGAPDGLPENDWVGKKIAIGDQVVLKVLIPCPRCVMTTLPQGELPLDSGILKTAARENNALIAPLNQKMPSIGVYAKVVRGGDVRHGDSARLV